MARASKTDTEIARLHAAYLLKLLRQGGMRVLRDEETDKVEYIDLPAAMINAINNHLKRMNINAMAASPADTDIEAEAERRIKKGTLKFKGKKIPPLSEEPDAATG
jgi:hypothetical protein